MAKGTRIILAIEPMRCILKKIGWPSQEYNFDERGEKVRREKSLYDVHEQEARFLGVPWRFGAFMGSQMLVGDRWDCMLVDVSLDVR